jgi:hypothetical protein
LQGVELGGALEQLHGSTIGPPSDLSTCVQARSTL